MNSVFRGHKELFILAVCAISYVIGLSCVSKVKFTRSCGNLNLLRCILYSFLFPGRNLRVPVV